MESRKMGLGLAVVAAVVAIVLFVVLRNDDSDTGTGGEVAADGGIPTIVVKDGKPVGGVQELTYEQGGQIRFRVDSKDTSDEVHFHGYDIGKDVEAGGQVTFDVPADISGEFEVELEGTHTQIAELTVEPS